MSLTLARAVVQTGLRFFPVILAAACFKKKENDPQLSEYKPIEVPLTRKVETEQVIVGNPAILQESQLLLAKHGNSQKPLPVTTPWDAVKMPIETRTYSGLNLDNDSHPDFLLIRSFTIYVAPGEEDKRATVSFAAVIHGTEVSDEAGVPSTDMIKGAKLIWWGKGDQSPIGPDPKAFKQQDGRHTIQIGGVSIDPNALPPFDSRFAIQFASDQSLYDHISAVEGYILNSRGYLSIYLGLLASVGEKSLEQYEKLSPLVANKLGFAYGELEKRYERAVKDPETAVMSQNDPSLLPFMRAAVLWTKKSLVLTEGESNLRASLFAEASAAQGKALKAFRWKGSPMPRSEFYATLAKMKDPEERKKLLVAYTSTVLGAYRSKGGLFEMIENLNKIARAHGYQNYADYVLQVEHGSSVEAFVRLYENFHERNRDELVAFAADLQRVNDGRPVYEWDVDFLTERLVSERLGGAKVPDLTYEQAFAVAKRYYRDLGIDLDKPPFAGKIIYDTKKREDRYPNMFAEVLGPGNFAWFNANFDPAKPIDLDHLRGIIHEWCHDIHIISSGARARGNVMNTSEGQPGMWKEGIAFALEDSPKSKAWMDRYLADLPQFRDPQLRAAISEVSRRAGLYKHMMVLSRARWELSLYETDAQGKTRPVEERLQRWPDLVRRYMHVEAMDATTGAYVYATPHFSTQPVYYVSYEGAFPLSMQVAATLYAGIEQNDPDVMRRGAAIINELFAEGSRLPTLEDIERKLFQLTVNPLP